MKKLLILFLLSFNAMAASNSNPGLYYGQIPTAAQWNSYFSTKLDYSPGAANAIPYWDASGNLLSAPASGSCTSVANVFTCTNATTANLAGGNIGFIPYQSAPDTTLFVTGNTTTTPQFLTSTGTGAVAQAPTLTGSTGTGNVVLQTGATVSNFNGVPFSRKAHIVNPNFQINQSGTSFAAPATGAYDLDGWLNTNTSAGIFTITQATGGSAEKLARIVTISTADTAVAAGDVISDDTRIEGYDVTDLVGQSFTVSFWAKFPVIGIHCVALSNIGTDRSYVHEINVASANTWTQYSFTITNGLPTAGTWNYTNGIGLRLRVTHMAGSTYQTSADAWNTGNFYATANQVNDAATISNVWGLQDVRIDLGTAVGSDWSSYQESLAKTRRYYFRLGDGSNNSMQMSGYQSTGLTVIQYVPYPVRMRTNPTITKQGTWSTTNCAQPGNAGSDTSGFNLYTTITTTGSYNFNNSNSSTMYFEFDARL